MNANENNNFIFWLITAYLRSCWLKSKLRDRLKMICDIIDNEKCCALSLFPSSVNSLLNFRQINSIWASPINPWIFYCVEFEYFTVMFYASANFMHHNSYNRSDYKPQKMLPKWYLMILNANLDNQTELDFFQPSNIFQSNFTKLPGLYFQRFYSMIKENNIDLIFDCITRLDDKSNHNENKYWMVWKSRYIMALSFLGKNLLNNYRFHTQYSEIPKIWLNSLQQPLVHLHMVYLHGEGLMGHWSLSKIIKS